MSDYNVAVIGGGPGGYVTAIRLSQLGLNPILFEKERLGGVCLNWGCIPTKALVKVAELFHEIKNHDLFGIELENPKPDYKKIFERKNNVVNQLVSGIEFMFKKRKIPVINEKVNIIEKNDGEFIISSENEKISVKKVILATGSKPKELPFMKFDGEKILSSKDVLKLQELPESLAVVGGGVIGCEFASVFSQLGVKVEIIEYLPNLVPFEDKEISKRMATVFKKAKVKVHTKAGVESFENLGDKVKLNLSNGKSVEAEKVLVSVGRSPVFDIETVGFEIEMENNVIQVNSNFETSEPGIFAIGDMNAKQMLAHTASKQGLLVCDYLKTNTPIKEINYDNVPKCTFTNPEIGSVGLTTEKANELYDNVITGKFPFAANGKAIGLGSTEGFVKVVADETSKKILGVHIMGPNATELIASGSLLVNKEMKIEEAADFIWAHPTLSEAIGEAIEDLENLAVHKI